MRISIAFLLLFIACDSTTNSETTDDMMDDLSAVSNLDIPIGAAAAIVWNGDIYLFGGSNNYSGSIVYNDVRHYDGMSWAIIDTIPDQSVWDNDAVLIGNDVYLVAGWSSNVIETRKYNLQTKVWTKLDSLVNSADYGGTTAVVNNQIYFIDPDLSVFKFSTDSDKWSTELLGSLNGSYSMNSVVYNSLIYVLGSGDSLFTAYSPANKMFTDLAKSPLDIGAATLFERNGEIYAIGGSEAGSSFADYKQIHKYNIAGNSWTTLTDSISSKRHWMSGVFYGGDFYTIGGLDSTSNAVNTVEKVFDF